MMRVVESTEGIFSGTGVDLNMDCCVVPPKRPSPHHMDSLQMQTGNSILSHLLDK